MKPLDYTFPHLFNDFSRSMAQSGVSGSEVMCSFFFVRITRFLSRKVWPVTLSFFIWFVTVSSSPEHSLSDYCHSRPLFIDTCSVKVKARVITGSVLKLRLNNLPEVIQSVGCRAKMWIWLSWIWYLSRVVGIIAIGTFTKNGFVADCRVLRIPGYVWMMGSVSLATSSYMKASGQGMMWWVCDPDSRKLRFS